MGRLWFMPDGNEMVRRRARVPKGSVVEAWADRGGGGAFWVGDESRRLLDEAGETPMAVRLSMPDDAVPVFYGPRLCDVESLPREESVRARVISMGGIAVAWITLDRFGERVTYEPKGPEDPVFHLRRAGGGAGHVWRRFETKREAIDFMREAYGADSEASEWAEALPVDGFDALLKRFGEKGA
ncbi:MAG TPA: hypothetical protein VGT02_14620 [Methylomirabilota bacterium]|jgi:hypothetical protein|nr:hypothetical protein [Methylomirabilota bacterium]